MNNSLCPVVVSVSHPVPEINNDDNGKRKMDVEWQKEKTRIHQDALNSLDLYGFNFEDSGDLSEKYVAFFWVKHADAPWVGKTKKEKERV